jgi:hypothetical protein
MRHSFLCHLQFLSLHSVPFPSVSFWGFSPLSTRNGDNRKQIEESYCFPAAMPQRLRPMILFSEALTRFRNRCYESLHFERLNEHIEQVIQNQLHVRGIGVQRIKVRGRGLLLSGDNQDVLVSKFGCVFGQRVGHQSTMLQEDVASSDDTKVSPTPSSNRFAQTLLA